MLFNALSCSSLHCSVALVVGKAEIGNGMFADIGFHACKARPREFCSVADAIRTAAQ
jgi:hypothetical protein